MKLLIAATTALALLSTAALAEDTNPKGAGGAVVSAANQALHDAGTNLGQVKKDAGLTGAQFGGLVSTLNHVSNQPSNNP